VKSKPGPGKKLKIFLAIPEAEAYSGPEPENGGINVK
jgi:hypothetical protein